jgi:hypothetical protein
MILLQPAMLALCAFAIALLAIFASVLLQKHVHQSRRASLKNLELRPNCLLTRYPLAFLAGPRSLFHSGEHWNEIPSYLREHGYEVIELQPSARGDRLAEVLAALSSLEGQCHLFADSSEEPLLIAIAQARHPAVASLTLVRNPATQDIGREDSKPLSADDLRPLTTAVETLELMPQASRQKAPADWLSRVSQSLLAAHNAFSRGRLPRVDAIETGAVLTDPPWQFEARFLDHAISLAERDVQWSD